ncbi:MAG: HIRAN domain-containing protein, partial [Pseudomonadota bacterium]|nr:HIRAN domain-containing protein [Pseudomonadota bacterium]
LVVHNYLGEPCGLLPRRGKLCREILAGATVGHISWQSIGSNGPGEPPTKLRVRVVLVDEGEHFEMPPMAPPRRYLVGIVGESNYQKEILRCSPGDRVEIVRERGNPYDDLALAVATDDGRTIGYIARDSWLRGAVHQEGKGCEATIKEIRAGGGENLGVVLEVTLIGSGISERQFERAVVTQAKALSVEPTDVRGATKACWLARLLRQ